MLETPQGAPLVVVSPRAFPPHQQVVPVPREGAGPLREVADPQAEAPPAVEAPRVAAASPPQRPEEAVEEEATVLPPMAAQ